MKGETAVHYSREVTRKIQYYGGTPCTLAVGKDQIWQGGLSGELLRMILEMIEERQQADVIEADTWTVNGTVQPDLPHLDRWRVMHAAKLPLPAPAVPPPPPPPPAPVETQPRKTRPRKAAHKSK